MKTMLLVKSRIRLALRFISTTPSSTPRRSLWMMYNECLHTHPLITKCVTSGILSFCADIVCQELELQPRIASDKERRDEDAAAASTKIASSFDLQRTARFTVLGFGLVGPVLHFWYGFLVRRFPTTSVVDAVRRLAMDQLVFAPAFIPTFFAANMTLEGRMDQAVEKIKNDWFDTVLANYVVWVPAQLINFKFVPAPLQVLFSNCVGFFWNIFLSYAANRKIDDVEPVTKND